jgi:CheY-like chemotaxis protein
MHDGTVTARSDGANRGSEFVVRLPLSEVPAQAVVDPSPTLPARPRLEARRILIADDNQDAAESLATLLSLEGHDVRMAGDGIEALAIAKTFRPEVVLLDLGMPRMDGYETARQIRRRPWGQRAILVAVTGWGQAQDRQRTADAGFDLHLVKPVSNSDLFQALVADPEAQRPTRTTAG